MEGARLSTTFPSRLDVNLTRGLENKNTLSAQRPSTIPHHIIPSRDHVMPGWGSGWEGSRGGGVQGGLDVGLWWVGSLGRDWGRYWDGGVQGQGGGLGVGRANTKVTPLGCLNFVVLGLTSKRAQ